MERLAALLPDEDVKKERANKDLASLNDQLGDLMMRDDTKVEDEADSEHKTKKLMTVARSKYYMLKVNYPKLAEMIDNEALPTFDSVEPQEPS